MANENAKSTAVESQRTDALDEASEIQRIKNEVAKRLLGSWLADNSGYDERVWQQVQSAIEQNRLSLRTKHKFTKT